jgi:tricorn protease
MENKLPGSPYKAENPDAPYISDQEGKTSPRKISIGESTLGWTPTWSPDSKYIAFVDNAVRIKVIETSYRKNNTGRILVAPILKEKDGASSWSPDSKWLVYTRKLHPIILEELQCGI